MGWTALPDLPSETPLLLEFVCDIAGLKLPDQQIWMVWTMPELWPVAGKDHAGEIGNLFP